MGMSYNLAYEFCEYLDKHVARKDWVDKYLFNHTIFLNGEEHNVVRLYSKGVVTNYEPTTEDTLSHDWYIK